jgi:hypothetical protein
MRNVFTACRAGRAVRTDPPLPRRRATQAIRPPQRLGGGGPTNVLSGRIASDTFDSQSQHRQHTPAEARPESRAASDRRLVAPPSTSHSRPSALTGDRRAQGPYPQGACAVDDDRGALEEELRDGTCSPCAPQPARRSASPCRQPGRGGARGDADPPIGGPLGRDPGTNDPLHPDRLPANDQPPNRPAAITGWFGSRGTFGPVRRRRFGRRSVVVDG